MARLFNGTDDSIEAASAPVTAVPLTIACWFRLTGSAAAVICSIGVPGATDRFQLSVNPGGNAINATTVQGGTVATGTRSVTIGLNTWHHGATVFSAINSRQVFFNGTGGAVNTGSATPSGLNRFNISGAYAPSLTARFTGAVAEVGIWNAALNAAEIASLSKGFPCRLVRPSALVFYSRLIRNVMDIRNGVALSELGTGTTDSRHPRIIYPC